MELETINKLYLELSQVATATTKREREINEGIGAARNMAFQIAFELRVDRRKKDARTARAIEIAEALQAKLNDLLP
jgi:hypothetical protein